MNIKEIIKHEKSQSFVIIALAVLCAGFAMGIPVWIGGIASVLALAFSFFRKAYK